MVDDPRWPEADPVERERVFAAATALAHTFGPAPTTAVVLGSGLGPVLQRLVASQHASFAHLCLPVPSVAGHGGAVHVGTLGTSRVALVAGRVHLYEGRSPQEVVRCVRALGAWGVQRLVLTNAAGGLDARLTPGSLVRIVDHLNLTGQSPLVGPPFGTRFPDTSTLWTPSLGAQLDAAAQRLGVPLPHGVYAGLLGPAYESPAEVRMLATLGAHLVGMSTVHEALAACALGLQVAGIATVTNLGAGLTSTPTDHGTVAQVAADASGRLGDILEAAL